MSAIIKVKTLDYDGLYILGAKKELIVVPLIESAIYEVKKYRAQLSCSDKGFEKAGANRYHIYKVNIKYNSEDKMLIFKSEEKANDFLKEVELSIETFYLNYNQYVMSI